MSLRPAPPGRVPTLTEVVRMPEAPAPAPAAAVPAPAAEPQAFAPTVPASLEQLRGGGGVVAGPMAIDEDELVQRVLADLQRQIDLMLEVKLREVLAPALTRATDALMREARTELASTLRDIVSRAVAQELSRHRQR
jgi:hypothetical protein